MSSAPVALLTRHPDRRRAAHGHRLGIRHLDLDGLAKTVAVPDRRGGDDGNSGGAGILVRRRRHEHLGQAVDAVTLSDGRIAFVQRFSGGAEDSVRHAVCREGNTQGSGGRGPVVVRTGPSSASNVTGQSAPALVPGAFGLSQLPL